MKPADFLKAIGVAACLSVAAGAYAQNDAATSGSANDTGATATAPMHAGKTGRAANRKLGYAVRRALSRTQGIDVSRIVVRSRNGHVTLLGTVPEQAQIDKAAEVAQGVDGVKSVSNKLALKAQGGQ